MEVEACKTKGSIKGYDFDDVTGKIIGAAIEVHKNLGPGFQEIVYQRALGMELQTTGLLFTREEKIPVYYKGKQIDTRRVDFVVEDYIVEIKARSELQKEDFIQALSYLKASDYPIGLLINFGREKVETRRFVGPKFREKKSDNQK